MSSDAKPSEQIVLNKSKVSTPSKVSENKSVSFGARYEKVSPELHNSDTDVCVTEEETKKDEVIQNNQGK